MKQNPLRTEGFGKHGKYTRLGFFNYCRAFVAKARIGRFHFLFSCSKLFTWNEKCSNFVQNLSFWGQYKMLGTTFDPIDALGTLQGGFKVRKIRNARQK